jgi:hypothetical protein
LCFDTEKWTPKRHGTERCTIAFKKALLATHGGLSLELCAVLFNVSPMAVYRLLCSFGRTCLVTLLTRCHLPLPDYFIVDEKHTYCLQERVYFKQLPVDG